jgi:hypothetical protein
MPSRPRSRAVTPRAVSLALGAALVVAVLPALTVPSTALATPRNAAPPKAEVRMAEAPMAEAPMAEATMAEARRAEAGATVPALWHDARAFGLARLASAAIGDPTAVGLRAALVRVGVADWQDAPPIDWRVLAGLDYLTGKATDTLQKLDGKQVRVPGFVVPLDDFQEDGAEFLLVPYYGACVHTPPPPPNQIVFVQMANKKAVKLALFDAIWMHGKLRIATVESPYGTVGFTIDGVKMEPYSSR